MGSRGDEEVLLDEHWSCFMKDCFARKIYSGRVWWWVLLAGTDP